MNGLLVTLGAIAFLAVGCVVGSYIGERVIPWLYDLIMGKDYRAWKRQREEESKAHRFWWEHNRKLKRELEAEKRQKAMARALADDASHRRRIRNWNKEDEE